MHKVFEFLIELFYWMTIWLSPALFFSIVAFVLYINNETMAWVSIGLVLIGVVLGAILAERIRKRHGCSHYVAKILGTPDIWPDEPQENTPQPRSGSAVGDPERE
jgi:hypothetical protein